MWGTLWKRENQIIQPSITGNFQNLPKRYAWVISFLVVVIFTASGFAFYYYSRLHKSQGSLGASNSEEALIREVSQLIVLPQDEQPTIATVADPGQLKDQPFFSQAKKGDKVLIYTRAKKAILYDPVNKRIVEVAPLNIGQTAGTSTPNPPASP